MIRDGSTQGFIVASFAFRGGGGVSPPACTEVIRVSRAERHGLDVGIVGVAGVAVMAEVEEDGRRERLTPGVRYRFGITVPGVTAIVGAGVSWGGRGGIANAIKYGCSTLRYHIEHIPSFHSIALKGGNNL